MPDPEHENAVMAEPVPDFDTVIDVPDELPANPIDADAVLLAAVDVARAALTEITPAETIGDPMGHIVEGEHVLSLLFECTMTGYPGWNWTVSLARVDENSRPSVLETELMPGEDSLLAPEWIPWSDRLTDYRAAQDLATAEAAADNAEGDDLDVLDDDDFDDDSGDDAFDGIEFGEALTAPHGHPEESDEPESESDDATPEPPAGAGGDELRVEDENEHKGHQPDH